MVFFPCCYLILSCPAQLIFLLELFLYYLFQAYAARQGGIFSFSFGSRLWPRTLCRGDFCNFVIWTTQHQVQKAEKMSKLWEAYNWPITSESWELWVHHVKLQFLLHGIPYLCIFSSFWKNMRILQWKKMLKYEPALAVLWFFKSLEIGPNTHFILPSGTVKICKVYETCS